LPSTTADEGKQWKLIWKINAPGKMKINLWRFVHDCLPTRIQLCRQNIPASDVYIFRGKEEDVEHSFLLCPFAREVMRVYSTNVQDEGLRIGGIGRRMNSKVKVSQTRRVLRINMAVNLA
jgi:hypothetical protein